MLCKNYCLVVLWILSHFAKLGVNLYLLGVVFYEIIKFYPYQPIAIIVAAAQCVVFVCSLRNSFVYLVLYSCVMKLVNEYSSC
jgi:hypothetical protein